MRWWLVGTIAGVVFAGSAVAAPFAWLAHQSTNRVGRMDLATHLTTSVAVGPQPLSTAASLDGSRGYSINVGDHTVSVIDGPSMSVVATVPIPQYPAAIALRADGARAYIPVGDGSI